VRGGGGDIWAGSDQFHFDSQTLAGDGSVRAHVLTQTNTNAWAKAGVMLRGSVDPAGAPFYDALVTPGNGIAVQYRPTARAAAVQLATLAGKVPVYLQVARAGTTFSAYTSADGVTWTLVPGSSVTLSGLGGTVLAGLAVAAHNTSALCTVTFDTVVLG
jgi:hypothetical protein